MIILTKEELLRQKARYVPKIRKSIFIHPTDTVYGLGCDATERKLVNKLRRIKEQYARPLSVIAPGMDWIYENCEVNSLAEEWLEKLPGPYTFILKIKNKECVARNIHLGQMTLGVRMPRHWFTQVISDFRVPAITTSVNKTGERFMRDLDLLDDDIKREVEYYIDEGPIEGKPSKLVDLTEKEPRMLRG